MARIYKYMLGALVLTIVVLTAVMVAVETELLGGALVLLVALVALLLVVRSRVNSDERAAQADWSDVVDDETVETVENVDGDDFTLWAPATDDLTTDDLATLAPVEAGPVEPDGVFPVDDAVAETAAFPGHDDFPNSHDFPSADLIGIGGNGDHGAGTNDSRPGSNGHGPGPSTYEPVLVPRSDDPADALAYVGAAAASNGTRRSIIDWSGPVRSVEEQVRTTEDILEASAATALPTGGDQPAPAAGSELARLLSKVQARLEDYE